MSETYGQMIRRLRKERDWTQKELAARSGVPLRTLQEVESDARANPQRATRLALNQALEVAGDPDQERAEWPNDVTVILDILGAFLMTMTPDDRRRWLREVLRNPGTFPVALLDGTTRELSGPQHHPTQ